MIVAAEAQDVPGQEERHAGSGSTVVHVAGVGQFVEELAGEFANAAAQEQLAPSRGGRPEGVIRGEQSQLTLDRPNREPQLRREQHHGPPWLRARGGSEIRSDVSR